MKTFCERLREERKQLKMNQSKFAALGGVGKTAQLNYEAGTREPDVAYLLKLEENGVDAAYILTGTRTKPLQPYPLSQCPVAYGVAEPGSPEEAQLMAWFRGLPEEARRGFLLSLAHTRQPPAGSQQVNGNVGQKVNGSAVNYGRGKDDA
jgi:transcriptional regulator with XRE-family HTH domain